MNTYRNNKNGSKISFSQINELSDNSMLKINPSLFEILDLEKNEKLNLDVFKATKGSEKKLWFICDKCGESYDMSPYHKINIKCKCPYCRGLRVGDSNSLANLNPTLAKEWDYSKNEKNPNQVTTKSSYKAWWIGICGHNWKASVSDRSNGKNCKYCTHNPVILKGENDLWTTNPSIAKLLVNKEDGYKYTKGSSFKVDFKCPNCKNIINRCINKVNANGLSCNKCSDGISFGEKLVYSLLKQLQLNFKKEVIFDWSQNKRYDFLIESLNLIIEVHGSQHYRTSSGAFNKKRDLLFEQKNDELKRQLVIENSNFLLIELDCSISELKYIKNSIENSQLKNLINLNNVNWDLINKEITSSKIKEFSELHNLKKYTKKEIAKKIGVSVSTLYNYQKKAKELNLIY